MRVGEVAALKWQHVDFKTNTIMVRKTQKKSTKGGELLGKPKYNSIRDIVVSQETMDILKTLKESYGDKISEYVFSSYRSHWKAISTDTYRDVLQVYKERVGMTRPFTFHDIRHTNASLMIYAGVPISVVSERLGHSSVAVTYSTYAHGINDCAERRQALVTA